MLKELLGQMTPGQVLAAIYNASVARGLGFRDYRPGDMTEEEAKGLVEQATRNGRAYFDYIHGRMIKIEMTLSDDRARVIDLDTRLHDRVYPANHVTDALLEFVTAPEGSS